MAFQPFNPSYASGQNVAPAAASASTTIPKGTHNVRLVNTGTNPCQVRIGTGAVTATALDFHLPGGATEVITRDTDHETLAYISSAGTTLNIMVGEGW